MITINQKKAGRNSSNNDGSEFTSVLTESLVKVTKITRDDKVRP